MMIRAAAAAGLAVWFAAAQPAAAEIDIDVVETPGGQTAWLVQDPSIPFVAVEVVFRGGTSLDAPGKRGAVNLMAALLEEGSGEHDARGFARARDDLAASIGFESGDDSLSLSLRFLSDTADAAVALAADALADPAFAEPAVERVRAQVLSSLRSRAEDPNAVASEAFGAAIYGDHPYATDGEGTLDSVAALTREDLVAAHRAAIARDRVVIAGAGNITPEAFGELIDRLLDGLPETGAPLPGPAPLQFSGETSVVPFPTPQSVISFGQPGIARDDPDFFAAYLLNQVLGGGGFGSRLTEEVRVKRGLTYGIYTYLAGKDHADLLVGRVATGNARAAETVAIVRQEWARMAAEGPTEEELEAARTYLIGGYPLRFDGNGAIARILVGMQIDGLDPSYVATRNDRVRAVTINDVRKVAAERLDPAALTFVVVGEPEGIEAGN